VTFNLLGENMKPINEAWMIQIPITNACLFECANCYRFIGHYRKTYFMDMKTIEKAIDSLEGFQGGIGITGGEPTLHPNFRDICKLLQDKVPSYKCSLWTAGSKWKEYKEIIKKTFNLGVWYNDHYDPVQKHQLILVGIDEVLDDKRLMWKLIDHCWLQETWSPSITPKGGFFCEVAGAMDQVLDEDGGYPLLKGWWNKRPEDFQDQVRRYCPKCSAAIPLERPSNQEAKDGVSRRNYERLLDLGSPKALQEKVQVIEEKLEKEDIVEQLHSWRPWDYLCGSGRKRHLEPDEIFLIPKTMRHIRWVYRAAVEGHIRGIQWAFHIAKWEIGKRLENRKRIHRALTGA
jgi:hypothetical protein